jgi:hypothetical protein
MTSSWLATSVAIGIEIIKFWQWSLTTDLHVNKGYVSLSHEKRFQNEQGNPW